MRTTLLVILILSSFAFAGVKTADGIWQRKGLMEKCSEYQKEVNSWWGKVKNSSDLVMPKDKVERAFNLLDQIQFPSKEDLHVIRSALDSAFADNYLKWVEMAGANCSALYLPIGKSLINSVKASPELKSRAGTKLKEILMANKYPTLLGASIDGVLMQYGVEHGLWKTPTSLPGDINKYRAELKQDVKKWADKYGKLASQAPGSIKDSSQDIVEVRRSPVLHSVLL